MFIPIADVLSGKQADEQDAPPQREMIQSSGHTDASRTPSHTSHTRYKDVRDATVSLATPRIARARETGNLQDDFTAAPPAWVVDHYTDVPSFGKHTANVYVDI